MFRKMLLALGCMALAVPAVFAHTATLSYAWKDEVKVNPEGDTLVLPHPSNFNGKMFKGWRSKSDNKLYPKWAVVKLDRDCVFTLEYANLDLKEWLEGASGVPAKHKTGKGILYALGDSITFGTKVGGNDGAWPKFVAEKLGLKCINDAKAGSRLSEWRSVLTQSRNHNQAIDSNVKGVGQAQMLDGIRKAGVIAFTLGTNDLMFENKGNDIAYRMFEFVEALHHENPQALLVIVGGKDMEAFRKGGKYAKHKGEQDTVNDVLAKALTGPKFKDYCVYVDISDLYAEHATYENCEREPDGVHPGRDGHKKIAEKILTLVEACENAADAPKFDLPPQMAEKADPPIVAMMPQADLWKLDDAGHALTSTREKFSLNGLWAFSPVDGDTLGEAPKAGNMKYLFKVPGIWPSFAKWGRPAGMAVYDRNGSDVVGKKIVRDISSAWYAREVVVPDSWKGRRIVFGFQWLPTAALVYVDGKKAGEAFFPGGEVDLTAALTPGKHEIAFYTSAKVAETLVTAFDAPDVARSFSKKAAEHRGVNGDVYLAAEPQGARIDNVQVRSHVTAGTIDFRFETMGEVDGVTYAVDVYDGGKKVKSFSGPAPVVSGEWKDAKVWDFDCPQNVYTFKARLEKDGKAVDELYAEEFGHREITLKGRDILINGSPMHFRPRNTDYSRNHAVANEDVAVAMKDGRKKGFNAIVPTSNYGFSEGDVTFYEMMARETSKAGMALVVGLPHPNRFDDPKNPHHWQYGPAYDRLVKHMVKRLQNIPGIIYYSSTHNATGYESDQNPWIISGRPEEVPTKIVDWRQRFRKLALEVNRKMKEFDPTRPVYHHESGAEGEFYTLNCYLDWAPIQERSDWFEHWQETGVMPLIVVEWGTPHIASWSSYRGGPRSVNIWSARNWTQQCWLNEFNSSLLGERAFKASPAKRMLMDRHQALISGNRPVYYGGNFTYPLEEEEDTSEVLSLYAERNYKDMRARGVTSFLPWDIDGGAFYKRAEETAKKVRPNALQGIKGFGVVRSDYFYGYADQYGAKRRKVAETLEKNYTDLLGWVAGPAGKEFTRVNNSFRPGDKVEKSLVILNDSRRPRDIEWSWKAGSEGQQGKTTVQPGCRADIPVVFTAKADMKEIAAEFKCASMDWKASDRFALIVRPASKTEVKSVALFDPEGTVKPLLDKLGVAFTEAAAAPKDGVLVIGRNAYSKLPFALKDCGARTLILEQDAATLVKMGFRIQEHGLRNLFALAPEFASLDLTDWAGNATLIPEKLNEDPMKGDWATTKWEGFKNRRVWRAGNRGIVSCVLPEKPTKGNFRPLVNGGFNLQYAPVMEYSDGGNRVVLSQLDICGRTESSPEAEEALAKLLSYTARAPEKTADGQVLLLAGGESARKALEAVGIAYRQAATAAEARKGDILVLGPGCPLTDLSDAVKGGVKVLCLNLRGKDVSKVYPAATAKDAPGRSYPDLNAALATEPLFRGISNADIQWTYPSNIASLAVFGETDVLKAFTAGDGAIVFSAISQGTFAEKETALRSNRRRAQGLLTRLIANLGGKVDGSFLSGKPALYADRPAQDDDPYRYYRW